MARTSSKRMPIDHLRTFSHAGHHRSGKSRSTTAEPSSGNLQQVEHGQNHVDHPDEEGNPRRQRGIEERHAPGAKDSNRAR